MPCERWRYIWSRNGSRNFARVARISQDLVSPKQGILRSKRSIRREAWEEYQASSASHSPVWFVNFINIPYFTKILENFWLIRVTKILKGEKTKNFTFVKTTDSFLADLRELCFIINLVISKTELIILIIFYRLTKISISTRGRRVIFHSILVAQI